MFDDTGRLMNPRGRKVEDAIVAVCITACGSCSVTLVYCCANLSKSDLNIQHIQHIQHTLCCQRLGLTPPRHSWFLEWPLVLVNWYLISGRHISTTSFHQFFLFLQDEPHAIISANRCFPFFQILIAHHTCGTWAH